MRRVFPVGAPVTAVSSAPGATSLYVIGLDNEGLGGGKVYTKFFPDAAHPGDWSDWLELRDRDPSVRRVFPVGAPVTAVSSAPGATSLYVIGLDNEGLGGGKVYTKFFPDAAHPGDWSDWFQLGGNVFPVGAQVTALSTAPGDQPLCGRARRSGVEQLFSERRSSGMVGLVCARTEHVPAARDNGRSEHRTWRDESLRGRIGRSSVEHVLRHLTRCAAGY